MESLNKDGIYKNHLATFFIKEDKIIMNLKGSYYKITADFMIGAQLIKPLSKQMIENFDKVYQDASEW